VSNSDDALSLELQKNDVGEETTLQLRSTFMPFFEQANELAKKAKAIVVTSENQTDDMTAARNMRLAMKTIRVDVDKKRKILKEDVVREGKAIDGMANIIKFLIVPVEEHLQEQEDFVKIREENRKAELVETRTKELREFDMQPVDIMCYNLGEMSEEGYQQLRDSCKLVFDARQATQILKLEREAKDKKAEALERAKIATENAKIETENKKLRAEAENTRKKQQEKLAKERAKLKTEREERERLESEIAKNRLAEENKKREAEEAEAQAQQASDKEKLWAFAYSLVMIKCADLESDKANAILKQTHSDINDAAAYIRGQCIDNL